MILGEVGREAEAGMLDLLLEFYKGCVFGAQKDKRRFIVVHKGVCLGIRSI